jgi:serine protease Do
VFTYLVGVSASAQALPDVIEGVKPSLVAVGSFLPSRNPAFQPTGTGFVIGDGRLIVTNAHVLARGLDTRQLEVRAIAQSERGTATVREVEAVVSDPAHDIALLRIKGGMRLPALSTAEGGLVREGVEIAMSGYPLSPALGIYPVTHRGIVAAIVPIVIPVAQAGQLEPRVVRQLEQGAFHIYQLDLTAYPGNSGSPVFEVQTGRVIGVVNSVFVRSSKEQALSAPTGITYAIPIEHVQALLKGLP